MSSPNTKNTTNNNTNNTNNINNMPPLHNPIATRRQSTAKLTSPLYNTPGSISQLSAIYKDRHSSSSTTNEIPAFNNNILTSNTPNSRKLFAPPRMSSPAIESDDDLISNNSPIGSYGSYVDDPTILKNVSKHLHNDPQTALKLASGDITRDLYQLNQPTIKRSKSFSGGTNDTINERRGSMASQMRLPGGFRRDFIQMKKQKFGYNLSQPTNFTKNFLEFLTIYGHFAGEDLEDEDYLVCDYDTSPNYKIDEESALLSPQQQLQQQLQNQKHLTSQQQLDDSSKTSSLKAFFLLIKAFIGTGVLFLPKAFSNGGLLFCIIILIIFSVLSYYCYLVLAQSTVATGISSFANLGGSLYGSYLKVLILVSIILTQIGFVAAYTIFTAENLKAFVKNTVNYEFPLYYFVIFETICFVPMSLIRNITKLSVAALLANIFILTGISTIIFYTAKDLIKNGPAEVLMFNKNDWSLFIGVAIFAFEGIGLIIPVQQSMRHPEDFPKILFAVMAVCCVLFISIGWLCYITYGADVQTMIILNLPQDSIPVILIQFFYALAIMLSVPLQLLPAIRLMESRIFKKRSSGKVDIMTKWYKNSFRTLITLTTSLIAYCGSANLDLFVSFIGSFACIPLVYMYPPMLHNKAVADTKLQKYTDVVIVVLGLIAMLYTTYNLLT
ncbi:Avt3 protein [Pichia kluyveri]|uniref:Avt3 protein n=1 Tax=Pichia kluyveri TaxID=36015 RepID=A0AAV5R044_PICKL|nr:Avt3 protein [Pichia kluyveri]